MLQKGVVIKADGNFAVVRVRRECACGSGSRCSEVCFAGETSAYVEARAINDANAVAGNIVELEADSRVIMTYAALIFIAPLAAGITAFFITDSFLKGVVPYIISGIFFAAVFAASAFTMNRNALKHTRIHITKIL